MICLASAFTVGRSIEKSTFGLCGVPVMFIRQSTRILLAENERPMLRSLSGTPFTVYFACRLVEHCMGFHRRRWFARHKLEVLLEYILDGELIYAVVYHIVAEHIERTLVKPVGSDYSVAVQRDAVSALCVHHQLQCQILRSLFDKEVDSHIRREVDVILFLDGRDAVGKLRNDFVPVDEALVADGVRTCHIIYKDASGFRLGINVDDGFAALAVDAYLAGGIYRAVEGVVAKLVGVVAQEVVGLSGRCRSSVGSGACRWMPSIYYRKVVVAVVDSISSSRMSSGMACALRFLKL